MRKKCDDDDGNEIILRRITSIIQGLALLIYLKRKRDRDLEKCCSSTKQNKIKIMEMPIEHLLSIHLHKMPIYLCLFPSNGSF